MAFESGEIGHMTYCYIKVECHANENPIKNSEKLVFVRQRLMYPIKKHLTMLFCF